MIFQKNRPRGTECEDARLWAAISPEPLGPQHPTSGKRFPRWTIFSSLNKRFGTKTLREIWVLKRKVDFFESSLCQKQAISRLLLHGFWWNFQGTSRKRYFFRIIAPAYSPPKQKKDFWNLVKFWPKILKKWPFLGTSTKNFNKSQSPRDSARKNTYMMKGSELLPE